MASPKMVKWVNHHRDYYSADGFVPRGTIFELPEGVKPPHLSVGEDGKPVINPDLAQVYPNVPVPGHDTGFEATTMSEVGMAKKVKASDR
jgi:hypothetical protein